MNEWVFNYSGDFVRFYRNSTNVTAPSNPNAIMRTNEPKKSGVEVKAKLAPIKCVWSAVSDSIYLNGREAQSFSVWMLLCSLFLVSHGIQLSDLALVVRCRRPSDLFANVRDNFSLMFLFFFFFILWMCVSPATPVVAFTILELFIRFRIQIERIIWIERAMCSNLGCVVFVKLSLVLAMSCVGFCSEYLLLIIQIDWGYVEHFECVNHVAVYFALYLHCSLSSNSWIISTNERAENDFWTNIFR